jgi:hypothetical protein
VEGLPGAIAKRAQAAGLSIYPHEREPKGEVSFLGGLLERAPELIPEVLSGDQSDYPLFRLLLEPRALGMRSPKATALQYCIELYLKPDGKAGEGLKAWVDRTGFSRRKPDADGWPWFSIKETIRQALGPAPEGEARAAERSFSLSADRGADTDHATLPPREELLAEDSGGAVLKCALRRLGSYKRSQLYFRRVERRLGGREEKLPGWAVRIIAFYAPSILENLKQWKDGALQLQAEVPGVVVCLVWGATECREDFDVAARRRCLEGLTEPLGWREVAAFAENCYRRRFESELVAETLRRLRPKAEAVEFGGQVVDLAAFAQALEGIAGAGPGEAPEEPKLRVARDILASHRRAVYYKQGGRPATQEDNPVSGMDWDAERLICGVAGEVLGYSAKCPEEGDYETLLAKGLLGFHPPPSFEEVATALLQRGLVRYLKRPSPFEWVAPDEFVAGLHNAYRGAAGHRLPEAERCFPSYEELFPSGGYSKLQEGAMVDFLASGTSRQKRVEYVLKAPEYGFSFRETYRSGRCVLATLIAGGLSDEAEACCKREEGTIPGGWEAFVEGIFPLARRGGLAMSDSREHHTPGWGMIFNRLLSQEPPPHDILWQILRTASREVCLISPYVEEVPYPELPAKSFLEEFLRWLDAAGEARLGLPVSLTAPVEVLGPRSLPELAGSWGLKGLERLLSKIRSRLRPTPGAGAGSGAP